MCLGLQKIEGSCLQVRVGTIHNKHYTYQHNQTSKTDLDKLVCLGHIRESVDSLYRDETGETSRDPRTRRLKTR